jgi:hypothetical protein
MNVHFTTIKDITCLDTIMNDFQWRLAVTEMSLVEIVDGMDVAGN